MLSGHASLEAWVYSAISLFCDNRYKAQVTYIVSIQTYVLTNTVKVQQCSGCVAFRSQAWGLCVEFNLQLLHCNNVGEHGKLQVLMNFDRHSLVNPKRWC